MTKVEVHYEFITPFQGIWTTAIERLHGVYGMQAVKLNGQMDKLDVTYDASRLKPADVDSILRSAGLPVRRLE